MMIDCAAQLEHLLARALSHLMVLEYLDHDARLRVESVLGPVGLRFGGVCVLSSYTYSLPTVGIMIIDKRLNIGARANGAVGTFVHLDRIDFPFKDQTRTYIREHPTQA